MQKLQFERVRATQVGWQSSYVALDGRLWNVSGNQEKEASEGRGKD